MADEPLRRPFVPNAVPPGRRPGVGDHVCRGGFYAGLIVDARLDGFVTVARRSRNGNSTIERDVPVERLQFSPTTPICATEDLDSNWTPGALG